MNKIEIALKKIYSSYSKKQIKAVVLFGSRARKDFNKNSDYDIEVFLNLSKEKKNKYNNFDEKFSIDYISTIKFKDFEEKGHSFLYCAFRDGLCIYQKNKWFDRMKPKIMKLHPSTKITSHYLESCLERLLMLNRQHHNLHYDSDEGKMAANQLGFGILMKNGIYPLSPHTIKIELINLNKKYKKLAEAIFYLQEVYYQNKNPKQETYQKMVKILIKFTKQYLKEYFPKNLKNILEIEKIYKKIKI